MSKMFEKARIVQDLEKRSELFETTLLDTIHAMESISLIIQNSLKIYDNEAIKKTLSEQEHVALATNFAANQITWSEMKKISDMHDNLRALYTELYKKDAVTAASLKHTVIENIHENIQIHEITRPILQPNSISSTTIIGNTVGTSVTSTKIP